MARTTDSADDRDQRTISIFARLLRGRFGSIVLPAIILQSLLIGGGYASGREVVAYGAKFGSAGLLAVLAIFLGFTVMSIVVFDLARTFRTYDYKSYMQAIIWKGWPLFDVLFIVMATVVIAVMASAAGSIMEQTLGIPYMAGIVAIIAVVGVLTYFGASLIERFKTVGTGFLYLAYVIFGVVVLSTVWGDVTNVLAAGNTSYVDDASTGAVLQSGALYVGYNLAIFPAVFFVLHRQETRKETIVSGLLAGTMMTLPFLLTYLCLMGFYPNESVMGAEVPWLPMLGSVGGPLLIGFYGVVIGWTLVETAVGAIHAIIHRVDSDLEEIDAGRFEKVDGLTPLQSGAIGVGILVTATLLSQFGIIALVAEGYTIMAYFFIALFAVPTLTVGLVRLFDPDWKREFWSRA
ncbi:hypothetical protein HUG10_14445 [Halorarum halophilum]|uniref:Membrane protein YkvI n=1 Tax=Halorarum halophilum TaxID=2743090 RepID=A0A7D5GGV6_9EURY|nr:hypothetical protein [Halobaculum halophilum]QLG28670.1 hypothetical protein HUG10_14445 [Halobaculum halophilum]